MKMQFALGHGSRFEQLLRYSNLSIADETDSQSSRLLTRARPSDF